MRILVFSLLFVTALLRLNAQNDSTKKIRFSGIQADLSTFSDSRSPKVGLEDYKRYVNDDYLKSDFSNYVKTNNPGYYSYYYLDYGFFGLRFYADIVNAKKFKKEVFIGLRIGREINSSLDFNKDSTHFIGIYTDPLNNDTLFRYNTNHSSYYFSTNSNILYLPFGINLTTGKHRYVWLTGGLEVAPGLSFNQTFLSDHGVTTTEYLLKATEVSDKSKWQDAAQRSVYKGDSHSKKTGGVGFSFYASVPLSVNLRLSKRIVFLKHINASASISPFWVYSNNKISGSASGTGASWALGIRYNL